MSLPKIKAPIQSTAGAVPTKNEKGDFTMEKVKVARYVSGKRPEYAPDSSDEEDDLGMQLGHRKRLPPPAAILTESTENEKEDRRLRRLQERHLDESDEDTEDRVVRHRRLLEPEVLGHSSDEEAEEGEMEEEEEVERVRTRPREVEAEESSEEEDEELEEEEIERRRALLRERARQRKEEEEKELLEVEEEEKEGSEEESSEWEEYSDSEEEEEAEPRLKPVFVRKKDRITIQEKEKELQKEKELELENKKVAEERRRHTLKLVEDEVRRELEEEKETLDACDAVCTDEENDEEEYEAWKVRELRRIKRDRDERDQIEKNKLDAERVHHMTEEERREEFKRNPKLVTNKATKGKYKFLQKYYHRGAFFLEEDDDVYKRDFSAPTLEDHFNKTVLPKVMQVKNFGRSGRTKYTHLVDQDTTQFDSPWMSDSTMNLKFHTSKGGGMKQSFDKPSVKKHQ